MSLSFKDQIYLARIQFRSEERSRVRSHGVVGGFDISEKRQMQMHIHAHTHTHARTRNRVTAHHHFHAMINPNVKRICLHPIEVL